MKKGILLLLALLIAAKAKGKGRAANALAFPNGSGAGRGCDPKGCGHFGARRGTRTHKGYDFLAQPGEVVRSPIYGQLVRYAYPYAGDSTYKGVYIEGVGVHEGLVVKMFYLQPKLAPGSALRPGQALGVAQDISRRWGAEMQPHIHLELYVNRQLVDPAPYFKLLS